MIYYSGGGFVWHNGIPDDELWIKIGGDTGGESFKKNFQIVNVKSPHSPQNTCVFAIFEARATTTQGRSQDFRKGGANLLVYDYITRAKKVIPQNPLIYYKRERLQ